MEIRENENVYIIAPLSERLDEKTFNRIEAEIMKEKRKVALDLSYVQDCSAEFIENIRSIAQNRFLGIFNIPSDIFVLFNMMNLDKSAKLFVSEGDFEENSRQLINRRFSLVKTF